MKKLTPFLLVVSLFFLTSTSSLAKRSLTIDSCQKEIFEDNETEVKVLLEGFLDGEKIHYKGAFIASSSSNYFGLTKYNDNWIKNSSSSKNQPEVIIGQWDGKLLIKPDLSDSGFLGSGLYNFKVGFYYYTSSNNLSSVNWSNIVLVNINAPPTPTQTVFPTNTASLKNEADDSQTDSDTYPSSKETNINLSPSFPKQNVVLSSPFETLKNTVKTAAKVSVLGEAEKATKASTVSISNNEKSKNSILLIMILILTGGFFIFLSVYNLFRLKKKL